jgi:hypothetical protein
MDNSPRSGFLLIDIHYAMLDDDVLSCKLDLAMIENPLN